MTAATTTTIRRALLTLAAAGPAVPAARAAGHPTTAPATRPAAMPNPIAGSATVTHGVFEDDDNGPPTTRPAAAAAQSPVTGTTTITVDHAPAATPAAAAADGDAKEVANPIYAAWAKLKPGSTMTWTSDTDDDATGANVHMVATETVKAVAADGVKLESSAVVGGRQMPAHTSTVPAKVDADEVRKKDGRETVKATVGGEAKDCACDVYDLSPRVLGTHYRGADRMTVYMSADTPGGMVRMTAKLPSGKDGIINLTGADAK